MSSLKLKVVRRVVAKVVGILVVTLLMSVAPVWAQQPTGPADLHHPSAPAPAPAAGGMQGPRAGGAMPMMDMCREMMGGSMMGMGGDQKMDPKMMAHMLQMRGEMMKAMGEVMMKHGKMMQGGTAK